MASFLCDLGVRTYRQSGGGLQGPNPFLLGTWSPTPRPGLRWAWCPVILLNIQPFCPLRWLLPMQTATWEGEADGVLAAATGAGDSGQESGAHRG